MFGSSSNRCLRDRRVFLACRCALACLYVGVVFWTWGHDSAHGLLGYWPIYLTNWSLTVVTAYLCFAAATTHQAQHGREGGAGRAADGSPPAVPWFVRATVLLHSIALPASILVATLFWTLVYKPGVTKVYAVTYFVHGINAVVMCLDAFICSQPFHLLKATYFFLYCVTYSVFSLVYFWCGGQSVVNGKLVSYIYAALDWSGHPTGAGVMDGLVLLVVVPLVSFLCWAIFFVRRQWLPACCRNTAGPGALGHDGTSHHHGLSDAPPRADANNAYV